MGEFHFYKSHILKVHLVRKLIFEPHSQLLSASIFNKLENETQDSSFFAKRT